MEYPCTTMRMVDGTTPNSLLVLLELVSLRTCSAGHELIQATLAEDEPNDIKPDQIANLGSIQVRFFRSKAVPRATPFIWNGQLPKIVDEVPEKAMKGREIKNNTK